MLRPRIWSGDRYPLPLPGGHRFPERKYGLLRAAVEAMGHEVLDPPAATRQELRRAHDDDYLDALFAGTLDRASARRIGLPWSPEMVERSRRSTGATLAAARAALEDGLGIHIAGGTHHAMRSGGEGYCTFNDAGVALNTLRVEGRLRRACIVDLDVHQGNGNAALFAGDDDITTFSVHGARNYPFRKPPSDLDIGLPDGTGDAAYLEALDGALPGVLDDARPELVLAICGADVWEHDTLGRLALTADGIAARDRRLFEECRRRGLPAVVTMGGGYGDPLEGTVAIQARTVALAVEILGGGRAEIGQTAGG